MDNNLIAVLKNLFRVPPEPETPLKVSLLRMYVRRTWEYLGVCGGERPAGPDRGLRGGQAHGMAAADNRGSPAAAGDRRHPG